MYSQMPFVSTFLNSSKFTCLNADVFQRRGIELLFGDVSCKSTNSFWYFLVNNIPDYCDTYLVRRKLFDEGQNSRLAYSD